MSTKEQGRSAKEMTKFLLAGIALSDWQIGFLTLALEESAESEAVVSDKHCINQLVHMSSANRGSILSVTHAITGLSFKCSWQGDYGNRRFVLIELKRSEPMSRQMFDALIDTHIWGTDAHRRALGVLVGVHS